MANVKYLKQVLDLIGIGSARVQMHFCSAAEGAKFSDVARKVTKEISELGPNPLKIQPPAE